MVEEIEFTEEDIEFTLVNFCKKIMIPRDISFTVSKVINLKEKEANRYSFEVCLLDVDDKSFLPKSYNLIIDNNKEKIRTSKQIHINLRENNLKNRKNKSNCQEFRIQYNNKIIGGVPLNSTRGGAPSTTLGCVIKSNNNFYALTCLHGLSEGTVFYFNNFKDKYFPMGTFNSYSQSDQSLDYLLIPITNTNALKIIENGTINFSNLNEYNCKNIQKGEIVNKYGNSTHYTKGQIYSNFVCTYNANNRNFQKGQIEIKELENCDIFSKKGDSGSLITDEVGNPLGILIYNKTNKNTIARPLSSIINNIPNNMKPIKFNF